MSRRSASRFLGALLARLRQHGHACRVELDLRSPFLALQVDRSEQPEVVIRLESRLAHVDREWLEGLLTAREALIGEGSPQSALIAAFEAGKQQRSPGGGA